MYTKADLSAALSNLATAMPEADRRQVLRLVLGTGAGLIIGSWLPALPASAGSSEATGEDGVFNPFVRIAPDSTVTVIIKHLDKGQGVATGLATLVAEELGATWAQTRTEFAPADTAVYKNLFFGIEGTGASTSIANSFEQYRKAGATARAMLVAAAAKRWGVTSESVQVSQGVVSSGANKASFGELAAEAAKVPVPDKVKLKDAKDFVYIGKSFPRVDSVAKTTGARLFTQDVQLDGMLVAVLARSPRFGGMVKSVDDAKALKVKGVVQIVRLPQGVAVLATSTYAAIKGRAALAITWDDTKAEMRGSDAIIADYKKLADTAGAVAVKRGDAEGAIAKAAKVISAEYVFPFLAQAPMEPMNCVIQLKDGRATVWTASQTQTIDQGATAAILGLKTEDVAINTQWAGGSFGRRSVPSADYVSETAMIVKATGRTEPIKLVWTREDDIQGGYYRPLFVHKVRVGLDAAGNIVGWHHRIVGQSINVGTSFEKMMVKNGIDSMSVEGAADTPYALPNLQIELHSPKAGPPPLWWRSVGNTHTAYVIETMIDEIAAVSGKDPVAYRTALLEKVPRQLGVLKLAAERAGWGRPAPAGVTRGIAVHKSFNTYVAQVVEVRMVNGKPKVDRVVAAVDCGIAVNPDNVRAQVEGGIGFGLGAILRNKITLKDGVPEQSNFDSYEVLRINEMPKVEVHIVPSAEAPTGIGEPGVTPIGPAVANAVAAATGKRIRVLPLNESLKRP